MTEVATHTFPDQSMVLPSPWISDGHGDTLGALKQLPKSAASGASTPSAGDVAATDIWATVTLPGCTTPTYVLLAARGQVVTAHNLATAT